MSCAAALRCTRRKFIGRPNQPIEDPRLLERMPGIRDQVECGLRPRAVQLPGRFRRRAGVVAALHDHAGNAVEPVRVAQQLAFVHEAVVDEVMVFDAREGECEVRIAVRAIEFRVGQQRDRAAFPLAPGDGGAQLACFVGAGQQAVVSGYQVVPVGGRNRRGRNPRDIALR